MAERDTRDWPVLSRRKVLQAAALGGTAAALGGVRLAAAQSKAPAGIPFKIGFVSPVRPAARPASGSPTPTSSAWSSSS